MPTDVWYQEIHVRLLAADPVASSELAEQAIEPLAAALRRKFPTMQQDNLIDDAVTDAFMNYVKAPSSYNPNKRGLFGYLLMSAEGDLRNAAAKRMRRHNREVSIEHVEVAGLARKVSKEAEDLIARADADRLQDGINQAFSDPLDLELLQLMVSGERKTDAFAAVLGLLDRTKEEQKRAVKRHKDRIMKRLQRLGASLRAE